MTGSADVVSGLNRALKRLHMSVRPLGAVVDDQPAPLLPSIELWFAEKYPHSVLPKFEYHRHGDSTKLISDVAKNADFVLLDDQLGGKFHGATSGLEIGERLVERSPNLPVIYYTAVAGAVDQSRPRVSAFVNRQNVTFFSKEQLNADQKLDALCDKIITYSNNAADKLSAEIRDLLDASVVAVEREVFDIDDYDGRRKTQTLRSLSRETLTEIEVPTSVLKRAGVGSGRLQMAVVEFSRGQVLTLLLPPAQHAGYAPEVVKMMRKHPRD